MTKAVGKQKIMKKSGMTQIKIVRGKDEIKNIKKKPKMAKVVAKQKSMKKSGVTQNKTVRKKNKIKECNAEVKDDIVSPTAVNQAIEGVRVLTKQLLERKGQNKDLLDDEEEDGLIFLQVGTVKVTELHAEAKHVIRPVKIKVPLPHSVVNSNTEVLLITKDNKNRKFIRHDHTKNLHYYQQKLRRCGASQYINEVLTLRQLKVEYKEYEAKRHLANRTDVVLCDDTIIRRIPMFLGKHFYGRKKFPVQVNLKSKNLLSEIKRALSAQILWLPMTGNSALMKIGRLDQTNEMIGDNIQAAVKKFKEKFPGGWSNIQSLSLKLGRSMSVPFYAKLNFVNDIGRIKPRPLHNRESVVGEVSSAGGKIFEVLPNSELRFVSYGEGTRSLRSNRKWQDDSTEKQNMKGAENTGSLAKKASKNRKSEVKVKQGFAKKTKVKAKKTSEESPEKISKKKKMDPEAETKANEETDDDEEWDSAEEDKLEMMEREYMKRISMEVENEKSDKEEHTKPQPDMSDDDDDDWAEGSDDDMFFDANEDCEV